MKINDPSMSGVQPGGANRPGLDKTHSGQGVTRGTGTGERAAGKGDGGDKIHLSDLGAQLRVLGAESPDRAARLEKLSADVQTGRYQVDALRISQRLIDDHLK